MGLHGDFGNAERVGDLGVGEPAGDFEENVAFAGSQALKCALCGLTGRVGQTVGVRIEQ